MDSQDRYAQRIEDTAESGRSVGASYARTRSERTQPPEPAPRPQGALRSRSKDYKELRQLGAKDFEGTTDPAEAEKWLKRTERIFTLMGCSMEDRFEFIVSLLQGDAYDW